MRRFVFVLVLAALASADGTAQTLTGRVLEDGREVPIAGAVVALVDRDDRRWIEAVSDSLGRFVLVPPRAGEYVVEAVRIGYETTRSPLFAIRVEGSVGVDLLMRPLPVGLEGIGVSVQRDGMQLLAPYGHSPASLGSRWIDRAEIEAMGTPGLVKDIIRQQNIVGMWVQEVDATQVLRPKLCVILRERRACALTVLNGVVISLEAAFFIDPRDIEAIAILDPADATTFYGSEGVGGAVLMWTRRGRR